MASVTQLAILVQHFHPATSFTKGMWAKFILLSGINSSNPAAQLGSNEWKKIPRTTAKMTTIVVN